MKRRIRVLAGLVFLILFVSGCTTAVMLGVGAGAGIGSYSYIKGELKADYPYPYDQTWKASLAALKRLEVEVADQQRDALGGKITGKRGDGKPVVVKIKDKGLGVTTVGIRVGNFGDREASRKIHQTILKILKG
ncbi:MAG: DUF3568 family protein [Deltaproteobacteria bacterium]|nr:DUF3568 family protein [Deltaproteobacteria bacterium]MBW2122535.1 DUF3568 family protein [Deltaproteobacteria bacterium]